MTLLPKPWIPSFVTFYGACLTLSKVKKGSHLLNCSKMRRKFNRIWILAEDEIRSLVINDDLEGASELLMDLVEITEKSRMDEAILISRGIKKLQKEERLGILDYNTASVVGNLLSLRIISLLNSLSPQLTQ